MSMNSKRAGKQSQQDPTEQEMVKFFNLLKSNNIEAKNAHLEYSTSQNKEVFWSKIVALCRNSPSTQNSTNLTVPVTESESDTSVHSKSQGKICFMFRQGKCTRGNCKFDHSLENLRAAAAPQEGPPKAISSPSNHETLSIKESTSSPEDPKKSPCQFYVTNGCCRKGDKCKYAHLGSERQGHTWVDISRRALRGIVSVNSQTSSNSKILASKIGVTLSDEIEVSDDASSKSKTTTEAKIEKVSQPQSHQTEPTKGDLVHSQVVGASISVSEVPADMQAKGLDDEGVAPYGGILEFLESRSAAANQSDGGQVIAQDSTATWMSLNLSKVHTPSPVLKSLQESNQRRINSEFRNDPCGDVPVSYGAVHELLRSDYSHSRLPPDRPREDLPMEGPQHQPQQQNTHQLEMSREPFFRGPPPSGDPMYPPPFAHPPFANGPHGIPPFMPPQFPYPFPNGYAPPGMMMNGNPFPPHPYPPAYPMSPQGPGPHGPGYTVSPSQDALGRNLEGHPHNPPPGSPHDPVHAPSHGPDHALHRAPPYGPDYGPSHGHGGPIGIHPYPYPPMYGFPFGPGPGGPLGPPPFMHMPGDPYMSPHMTPPGMIGGPGPINRHFDGNHQDMRLSMSQERHQPEDSQGASSGPRPILHPPGIGEDLRVPSSIPAALTQRELISEESNFLKRFEGLSPSLRGNEQYVDQLSVSLQPGVSVGANGSKSGVIGKPGSPRMVPAPLNGVISGITYTPNEAPSLARPEMVSPKTEGAKTQALLSYLRSRGISPSLSHGSIEDPSNTLRSDIHTTYASESEPALANRDSSSASMVSHAAGEQRSGEKELEKETEEKNAPKVYYRVTQAQRGRLRVNISQSREISPASPFEIAKCMPGGVIKVDWEVPTQVWREKSGTLVMSLCRYGTQSNTTNIVAKALTTSKEISTRMLRISAHSREARGIIGEDEDHEVTVGLITFHAPKAGGYYVFRIYDRNSDESAATTIGTSTPFCVELRGRDVTSNLSFSLEGLCKKVDTGSISGLKNTFELMRSTGAPLGEKHPQDLIQKCVRALLDAVQKEMQHLNKREEALALLQQAETNGLDAPEISDTVWSKGKSALRIHGSVYDCLCELRANKIPWSMLSPPQKETVVCVMSLYCPILRRFFDNSETMHAARLAELGFVPYPLVNTSVAGPAFDHLNASMHHVLGTLMPSRDFYGKREEVRVRLQRLICTCDAIPPTTELVVFGSSRNNFGNDGADLDMCLHYSPEEPIPTGDNRGLLIEKLGAVLTAGGMQNVQVRSTARIPIVLFTDPMSGMDCDISFNNPLAIRNTLLLASYSVIDPRVRELAYVIKYWAKQRKANSPQEGTLSSYGYLLCLVHFLQTRNPPVLPDLQNLPPDWVPTMPVGVGASLPKRWEKHPVEDCYCNTYFYEALFQQQQQYTPSTQTKLQDFSSRNTQSSAELLVEFFRYYAYEFDYHSSIVSIRGTGVGSVDRPRSKVSKMESDCWGARDRLCIEDPFETWYDIAHVIKGPQMSHIRKEFLRAYTLIMRASHLNMQHNPEMSVPSLRILPGDKLATEIDLRRLFGVICEEGEIPKFVLQALEKQQARSRANTLLSEEHDTDQFAA